MIDKTILIELVGKLHITLGLPPIRGGQFKKSWLLREYSRCAEMMDLQYIKEGKII